jgi:hypothetical protein
LTKNQSGVWNEAAYYSFPASDDGGPIGGLLIPNGDVFGFIYTSKLFGYAEVFEFSH